MKNLERKCEWCNKVKKKTIHHVKNRLGDKEEYYTKYGNLVEHTINVCRPCHNEIEEDYKLVGKVIIIERYMRENTLKGIEHNLHVRMSDNGESQKYIIYWLEKKIRGVHGRWRCDKSCKTGLYYTQQMNTKPYRECIMKLAIALNDIRVIPHSKLVQSVST